MIDVLKNRDFYTQPVAHAWPGSAGLLTPQPRRGRANERALNCVTLVGIEWYYDGCGSFFSSARLRFLGAPLGSAAWLGLALRTSPWGPYQKCSTSGGSWASFAFSASSGTTADGRLSSAVQKATGHLIRGGTSG